MQSNQIIVRKSTGLWCLTPLSSIFQLYHGVQLYLVKEPREQPWENHQPVSSTNLSCHHIYYKKNEIGRVPNGQWFFQITATVQIVTFFWSSGLFEMIKGNLFWHEHDLQCTQVEVISSYHRYKIMDYTDVMYPCIKIYRKETFM